MRDKDNIVWSSTANTDFWLYDATDEDVIDQYSEYYDDDVILMDGESANIDTVSADEMDVDEMRSVLADDNYLEELDYEELEQYIAPAVAGQCYNNYLWFIGNYQRWSGGHEALGFYDNAEDGLISVCYPNYDSHSELLNDDGSLVFTEYTHDTPMGGTYMTLYSIKDADTWNAAEDWLNTEYTELDTEGNERHIPEYWGYEADISDVAEDFDVVRELIERGYLTPVSAKLFA